MSSRRTLGSLVTLLAVLPGSAAAQTGTGAEADGASLLVGLALIVGVMAAFTIVVGAVVLAVSTPYVEALERRIYDAPVRSGAVGIATLIGGFVLTIVALFAVAVVGEIGVGEPVVGLVGMLLLAALVFGGMVLVTLADVIGSIVAGLALLRRFGSGEPNRWLALVVGSVVVSVLYLVPLVNVAAMAVVVGLGAGAMVGHWRSGRNGGASGSGEPAGG